MMCFSGQGLRCLEPSNNPGGYAQKGRPKIEIKSLISLEYLNNFLLTVTQGKIPILLHQSEKHDGVNRFYSTITEMRAMKLFVLRHLLLSHIRRFLDYV